MILLGIAMPDSLLQTILHLFNGCNSIDSRNKLERRAPFRKLGSHFVGLLLQVELFQLKYSAVSFPPKLSRGV
jgi:hypothetical protein